MKEKAFVYLLSTKIKLYWLATSGGRVSVVAVCVLHAQLRISCAIDLAICIRKQKKHLQKRLIKLSAKEATGKQFYQPTLMPTPLHFRGMTIFQTYIIKYRNKHAQIAVLIFSYLEQLKTATNLQIKVTKLL